MRYLSLVILLLCAACTASPANVAMVPPLIQTSGSATIVATRDSGTTGSDCFLTVFLDGVTAAKLWTDERTQLKVAPGKHLIEVEESCGGMRTRFDMKIEAGQTIEYRLLTALDGSVSVYPAVY